MPDPTRSTDRETHRPTDRQTDRLVAATVALRVMMATVMLVVFAPPLRAGFSRTTCGPFFCIVRGVALLFVSACMVAVVAVVAAAAFAATNEGK